MANYNDHSYYSLMISYFLLLLLLLLITPTAASDNYNDTLNSFCLARDQLLLNLVSNASISGAAHGSMDNVTSTPSYEDYYDGVIYGLALCEADISPGECTTCLTYVTSGIKNVIGCDNMREIINFGDNCFVKYSTIKFYNQIDTENVIGDCDGVNKGLFPAGTDTFLNGLIGVANTSDINMFASANYYNYTMSDTYHGLVQCTMGLPKHNCTVCLHLGTTYIVKKCSNSLGGMYYSGSCIVRYHKIKIE